MGYRRIGNKISKMSAGLIALFAKVGIKLLGVTVRNQMTVQPIYREIKPNCTFMDITLQVNSSVCKDELERREKVKLWKAVETGDKKKIEYAKKELRKFIRYRKYE